MGQSCLIRPTLHQQLGQKHVWLRDVGVEHRRLFKSSGSIHGVLWMRLVHHHIPVQVPACLKHIPVQCLNHIPLIESQSHPSTGPCVSQAAPQTFMAGNTGSCTQQGVHQHYVVILAQVHKTHPHIHPPTHTHTHTHTCTSGCNIYHFLACTNTQGLKKR